MSKIKAKTFLSHRFGPVITAIALVCLYAFVTRVALLVKAYSYFDLTILNLLKIFGLGLVFDFQVALYISLPLILFLWAFPSKYTHKKIYKFSLFTGFFLLNVLLLLNLVSEYVFWDEFSVRYNFIAVDYLVYTTEVLSNIWQSYHITIIVNVILVLSMLITFFMRHLLYASINDSTRWIKRSGIAFLLAGFIFLSSFITRHTWKENDNPYVQELSGNGLYEFGYAFWNNQLDYNKFYKTIPQERAEKIVQQQLNPSDTNNLAGKNSLTSRHIRSNAAVQKRNVILISVESLSAEFLGVFGNKENLTPNLDALSREGILFTRAYASGTRTVRGLEALSLCIPPTPGQSIIKRQHNKNMFTVGNLFSSKGYRSRFIYGGYAYFDNMKEFFSNNGYQVTDRNDVAESDITYQNAWGIADEDLFNLSIRQFDKDYELHQLFFGHIMTVSNHRPYTYPANRIDIPSHTGRAGAVKYTDYAIGKFIRDAKQKPWFSNTIFIIVADHCASSAGKVELPVEKYHIPLIMYAPGILKPGKFERLTAQVDIGPTIFGILNFNYTSKFFGQDVFKIKQGEERAFISTYQSLGYLKHNQLIILDPNKRVSAFKVDPMTGNTTTQAASGILVQEAIADYQMASDLYSKGLYQFKPF